MEIETIKLWNNWSLIIPKEFKCFSNGNEYVILDDTYVMIMIVIACAHAIKVFKPIHEASYEIDINNKSLTLEVVDTYEAEY